MKIISQLHGILDPAHNTGIALGNWCYDYTASQSGTDMKGTQRLAK